MNVNEIITAIKSKCALNKYNQINEAIDLRIRSGSTGSEINAAIGSFLNDLQFNNPQVYDIIKEEIEAFIELNRRNGIVAK